MYISHNGFLFVFLCLFNFNIFKMSSSTPFQCDFCDKQYNLRNSLAQHLKRSHSSHLSEPKNKCIEPGCTKSFFNVANLRKHLDEEHQKDAKFEQFLFKSLEEFNSWKEDLEQKTNARYVTKTGTKTLSKQNSIVTSFECHRSGFARSQSRYDTGNCTSKKLNARCPAQIRLFETGNEFMVHFYQMHSHKLVSKHCPLSQKTQESVASMIQAGYSNDHILKLFDKLPSGNRDRYLTADDIRIIINRKGLTNQSRNHKDDAKSVHIFAEKNKEDVILYRPNTAE
jgi:hypothetical protein